MIPKGFSLITSLITSPISHHIAYNLMILNALVFLCMRLEK